MTVLTQELVRGLFHYDETTGVLTWRVRDASYFKTERASKIWNSRFAGKRAGRVVETTKNYKTRSVRIFEKDYYEHRVIWLYVYGTHVDEIDHIDNNATNNTISNLRDGDGVNHLNKRMHSRNTSGVSGVRFCPFAGKWVATCSINRRRKYVGGFNSKDEASAAILKYRESLGFSENHGKPKDA